MVPLESFVFCVLTYKRAILMTGFSMLPHVHFKSHCNIYFSSFFRTQFLGFLILFFVFITIFQFFFLFTNEFFVLFYLFMYSFESNYDHLNDFTISNVTDMHFRKFLQQRLGLYK